MKKRNDRCPWYVTATRIIIILATGICLYGIVLSGQLCAVLIIDHFVDLELQEWILNEVDLHPIGTAIVMFVEYITTLLWMVNKLSMSMQDLLDPEREDPS